MSQRLTDSRLANLGARAIQRAFVAYQEQFQAITRRARARFARRDWPKMQRDAAERLDLYQKIVDVIVEDIGRLLAERVQDKLVWASMKAVYSGLIADRDDWEIAETFYNSVTRRIFTTVGVDPQIEFVATDFVTPPTQARQPVYRTYQCQPSTHALLAAILADYAFEIPYENRQRDVTLAAATVEAHLRSIGALPVVEQVEMISAVFYRDQGAYLIGRLYSGSHLVPLVLALLNTPQGITVDAVLLQESDVSILFSFARSYFHVTIDRPYDLVRFLQSIMPRKRVAELYISLGYNKHGKTELYRHLLHHLAGTNEQFELARGERGMVMSVFTMPAYDVVFKLIKDHFAYPKNNTRQGVMDKYRLVFKHDRAGRLVDAQEFEHLQFDRQRFSAELLDELQRVAGQTVTVVDDQVVIKHAYVERRMIPLDIFLRQADDEAVRAAVIDYGQAIKDLAASNIFPGDMLLKNFGVTRHGRVIFYDYDELSLLTGCHFRAMPQSRTYEDELSRQPWFTVGDHDIFPQEFHRFLGLRGPWRDIFMARHADLFTTPFWRQIQERLIAGEVIHVFAYEQHKRLRR